MNARVVPSIVVITPTPKSKIKLELKSSVRNSIEKNSKIEELVSNQAPKIVKTGKPIKVASIKIINMLKYLDNIFFIKFINIQTIYDIFFIYSHFFALI